MFNLIKEFFSKKETKPLGRHSLMLITKEVLLGEKITDLERQIAVNKDKEEYEEILTEIDDIYNYIKSNSFTDSDLQILNRKINDTLTKGYNNSIIQTYPDLEEKCLSALYLINEYIIKNAENRDISETEIEKIKESDLHYSNLGFLSDIGFGADEDADVQMGMSIIKSLFKGSDILIQTIAVLPEKDRERYITNLKIFLEKLSKQKRLSDSEIKKVQNMINRGVELSKEYYK